MQRECLVSEFAGRLGEGGAGTGALPERVDDAAKTTTHDDPHEPGRLPDAMAGMTGGGFTRFPNHLLDVAMAEVSPTEWRVLCYIVRRTIGFGRSGDCISNSQFVSGIVRDSGARLDRGAGVGRTALKTAIRALSSRGLIVVARRRNVQGGSLPSHYELSPGVWGPPAVPLTGSPCGPRQAGQRPHNRKRNKEKEPEPERTGQVDQTAPAVRGLTPELAAAAADATSRLGIGGEFRQLASLAVKRGWKPAWITEVADTIERRRLGGFAVDRPGAALTAGVQALADQERAAQGLRATERRQQDIAAGVGLWMSLEYNPVFTGHEQAEVSRKYGPDVAEQVRQIIERRKAAFPQRETGHLHSHDGLTGAEGRVSDHAVRA